MFGGVLFIFTVENSVFLCTGVVTTGARILEKGYCGKKHRGVNLL